MSDDAIDDFLGDEPKRGPGRPPGPSGPPDYEKVNQSGSLSGNGIQRVSYTHEAMIDLLIARPMITQAEIAAVFGYTQAWVSRIVRSDAFREMIAARKSELVDPLILQSIDTRLNALVEQSIEVLQDKLQASPSADIALKALEVGSRALGYGAAKNAGTSIVQNFVVAMPQKEDSSQGWAERFGRPAIEGVVS